MIALTFSPYSRETIEACKFARARGVKLILISDSDVISTEFTPEETLIASVISTHHFSCYTGVVALLKTCSGCSCIWGELTQLRESIPMKICAKITTPTGLPIKNISF